MIWKRRAESCASIMGTLRSPPSPCSRERMVLTRRAIPRRGLHLVCSLSPRSVLPRSIRREASKPVIDLTGDDEIDHPDPDMRRALRASLEESGIGKESSGQPSNQLRPSDRIPDPSWALTTVSSNVRASVAPSLFQPFHKDYPRSSYLLEYRKRTIR
jgi:hypothetical protein